jgi:PAS domain S-box-containing protein
LGIGQWNIPRLRELLEDILPRNSFFNDFEVAQEFPMIGRRTMLLNARQFHGEGGSAQMILLAIEDATERLESRAALRRSEMRYRRLFETGQDGILIMDSVSRKITDANPFMTRLLGFTHEELLGKELWQIGLLKDEQSSHADFRELQQHGYIRYENLPLQNKNGEKREVEVIANLYDEDGAKVIQCNIRDVTQRKNAERQLAERARQQQQLYQFVEVLNRGGGVENMYDAAMHALLICLSAQRAAILLFDNDGVIRFKAWRNLSENYRRDAEHHSPWPKNSHDPQPIYISNLSDAPPELQWLLPALRREGIAALDFIPLVYQGQLLGKFMVYYDGSHQCNEAEVQLALAISNQLAFALERKRTETSLREAKDRLADQAGELEKLVNERTAALSETVHELEAFSYSISHDLRAPLRAMNNFAQLLQDSYRSQIDETGRIYLDRISRSAERLDTLIQDVLNYARLVRAQVPLASVDLQRLFENIIYSYPDFQPPNANIQIEGALPSVLGHEGFLTQCISNLLSNAVKFVAPGVHPSVKIWADESAGAESNSRYIRLNFEDNGIGIAPENHQRIFRMFERIHSPVEYEGTGIGLTIARKAVERMGGRIGFESQPGRGSKFWIELKKVSYNEEGHG